MSFRVMPTGCIFADKGPAAFVENDDPDELLALVCLLNSKAFGLLVSVQLARVELAQSFEVGLIQQTPVPDLIPAQRTQLAALARRAWSLKRSLDTVTETSHAFLLPLALRQAQAERQGAFEPPAIEAELARIQAEIDDIAFSLYGFSAADRAAALGGTGGEASDGDAAEDADSESDEDEAVDDTPSADALLSWAVGVAFGRFDIRLATGERAAPPEPEPFDPLPAKSPGMLPDGDAPFHAHAGILVDDPGHAHDLVGIAERVLERVDMPVPAELRRWLQKDFFPFHLQRYSKSRRKAPIYWPLSTASGSYTLWLYYPSLTRQTLYTAINDFVEPKLAEVETEAATLRSKASARSRDEEKRLEALTALQAELRDLRDQLQAIAPQYQPKHDDGVQITAAPLWPLFRHKPWQKLLKDTWAKLEKGDYDWAHLAMTYWRERVRDKCRHDKSLAIAHGLEDLYVEPPAAPKKARGRKTSKELEA
ncbi:BREX-1 system adenine-specific DNA-methyltransferase PglX [Thauera aromatica]|uniref:BREX-1 system adenine-specific DNA-methyltransferase PglX n=1 Tax=Thauera aromatica TaxID=59405 RepID=UPI001FFC441E|nr:BREX-1 system adenine-specific DNA-methyltransferase PglX [Thauera aromatica]MCK2088617.1 BREX-1 system adenine-specific DNA-methyltransferase PglX [Thauera aromatica]